ncbi:MAG TPA: DUF3795 domain-containing protein [Candidatus Edwardsbacteria bacterium]|nr:DUF3795 domain-containing protein [Candidatus Edwardsbacteria bacterium]
MPQMLAICGLDCATCPAYIAHSTNDNTLREKTAKQWAQDYKAPFTPEMIDCVGCTVVDGPHIGHCAECQIRICGLKKKEKNCGHCAEYPCAVISTFIENVPPAKANLEAVKKNLNRL